jgi:hypothetical protein
MKFALIALVVIAILLAGCAEQAPQQNISQNNSGTPSHNISKDQPMAGCDSQSKCNETEYCDVAANECVGLPNGSEFKNLFGPFDYDSGATVSSGMTEQNLSWCVSGETIQIYVLMNAQTHLTKALVIGATHMNPLDGNPLAYGAGCIITYYINDQQTGMGPFLVLATILNKRTNTAGSDLQYHNLTGKFKWIEYTIEKFYDRIPTLLLPAQQPNLQKPPEIPNKKAEQILFTAEGYEPLESVLIGTTHPLMAGNIRWNHMPLRVYLDITGSNLGEEINLEGDVTKVREALLQWNQITNGIISFTEVAAEKDADITVMWIKSINGTVTGRAGPRFLDTGLFNLSKSGEVLFVPVQIKEEWGQLECDMTEVHEFGHILGLTHKDDLGNVMDPHGPCGVITHDIVATLSKLYEIRPLPELSFYNTTAIQDGGTLYLGFGVRNRGLVESPNTAVLLKIDGNPVQNITVPSFQPGYGQLLWADVPISTSSINEINLTIDSENRFEEISKEDNSILLHEK